MPKVIRIEDILIENGEEHLFYDVKVLAYYLETCAPVFFRWMRGLEGFVQPIETAQKQAALPGGSPLPPDLLKLPAGSVTVETFKKQLMLYAGCRTTQDLRGTTCVRSSMEGLIGMIKYLE
ncbi:hypothetical protein PI124_g3168 [Phytophthora idaei]|nr:hypothetical protein PI125_g1916 [Phytophthora idaei]KAG3171754.1 hypothetical protein PI126_g1725 [Phytophthora idaei]KAG3252244.1 hypothetical protein PI124_g3168 [Phytophthora idaei]